MKKLSLLYSLFFVFAVGFLTSCGEDDEVAAPPSIDFVSPATPYTASAGEDSVEVTYLIEEGDARLSTLQILANNLLVTEIELPNEDLVKGTVKLAVPAAGNSQIYTFTVTDRDDERTSENFEVIAESATTPLSYENSGAILGNKIGDAEGAYDLVNNKRDASNASTSDMQNPSTSTGTTADQWIKGWDGENNTVFVKANSYDYANATVESAQTAFNDQPATSEVRNVAVGDIFIAKLRGGNNFAVIKVTGVDADVDGANTEEITFDYKKSSETAGQ